MVTIAISERPLMGLFGSESAYKVLMFLQNYEKGYASEIAKTYGISLNQIQNQLNKFEDLGILKPKRGECKGVLFQAKSGNRCIESIPQLNA
jgi:predicted transcriptional regulator